MSTGICSLEGKILYSAFNSPMKFLPKWGAVKIQNEKFSYRIREFMFWYNIGKILRVIDVIW